MKVTDTQPKQPLMTREELERLFNYQGPSQDDIDKMSDEQKEQHAQFSMMVKDLRWPVTREGDVANIDYIAALVAYHLVRCGWRNDPEKRVIKSRKVIGRGVATGALEWVGMDEPDDPLADIANMTMAEVAALSPQARFEAIRRLGGNAANDIPEPKPGWQCKPNIRITDIDPQPFVDRS